MELTRDEAKELATRWGWKKLPQHGKQYLRVGCSVTWVLENYFNHFLLFVQ